ncbi:MAG: hypothetical protein MUF21_10125 [Gemmatimonadaceae bacterium]|nr:hypothetical protein [Gemmatimonadaceae bacterium]
MRPTVRLVITLSLMLAATGCASTSFTNTWKNPEAQQLSLAGKTVVVSVQRTDEAARRAAEDALVAELNARGAKGIASYTLGGNELRDTVSAQRAISRTGAEALVVMRVTGTQDKVTSSPVSVGYAGDPFFGRPWGFWGSGWSMAYSTPQVTTTQIVTVETRVYSLPQSRLVWAGTSQTSDPSRLDRMILDIARRAGAEMRKEGLLAGAM